MEMIYNETKTGLKCSFLGHFRMIEILSMKIMGLYSRQLKSWISTVLSLISGILWAGINIILWALAVGCLTILTIGLVISEWRKKDKIEVAF